MLVEGKLVLKGLYLRQYFAPRYPCGPVPPQSMIMPRIMNPMHPSILMVLRTNSTTEGQKLLFEIVGTTEYLLHILGRQKSG
jgi:hypothetical protein